MANLVIDIGNTAVKAAWADGMTLGKTFRYQGERVMDFILSLTVKVKPEVMVISSARELYPKDRDILEKECGSLVVIGTQNSGVLSGYGLPPYLTPDRAASVIAAKYLFKGKGCTVFDFGTTLTVDFIDVDGGYAGGNISVGCRTRFKAINRYSKRLPLLDTPDVVAPLGTSLCTSVESGIIQGIIYEIEGYIGQNPENIIVFTGGDAIYFAKRMKNSIFVVCNLVLMGLALMADNYDKKLV